MSQTCISCHQLPSQGHPPLCHSCLTQYKNHIASKTKVNSPTLIVFDLEATCWNEHDGELPKSVYVPVQKDLNELNAMEVIEVGAVALSTAERDIYGPGTALQQVGEFCKFVRPTIHPELSEFCIALTSITQRDVNMADPIETVLPRFIEWARSFTGEAVFISWGMFDKAIFERMVKKQGKSLDIKYLVDNHFSAKHRAQKKGLYGKGLGKTLEHHKIKFSGRQHRGIDDARNIAKLVDLYYEDIMLNYTSGPVHNFVPIKTSEDV